MLCWGCLLMFRLCQWWRQKPRWGNRTTVRLSLLFDRVGLLLRLSLAASACAPKKAACRLSRLSAGSGRTTARQAEDETRAANAQLRKHSRAGAHLSRRKSPRRPKEEHPTRLRRGRAPPWRAPSVQFREWHRRVVKRPCGSMEACRVSLILIWTNRRVSAGHTCAVDFRGAHALRRRHSRWQLWNARCLARAELHHSGQCRKTGWVQSLSELQPV